MTLSETSACRKQLDAAREALWRADRLDLPDEIRALNVQMSIAGSLTVIAQVLLDKNESEG